MSGSAFRYEVCNYRLYKPFARKPWLTVNRAHPKDNRSRKPWLTVYRAHQKALELLMSDVLISVGHQACIHTCIHTCMHTYIHTLHTDKATLRVIGGFGGVKPSQGRAKAKPKTSQSEAKAKPKPSQSQAKAKAKPS